MRCFLLSVVGLSHGFVSGPGGLATLRSRTAGARAGVAPPPLRMSEVADAPFERKVETREDRISLWTAIRMAELELYEAQKQENYESCIELRDEINELMDLDPYKQVFEDCQKKIVDPSVSQEEIMEIAAKYAALGTRPRELVPPNPGVDCSFEQKDMKERLSMKGSKLRSGRAMKGATKPGMKGGGPSGLQRRGGKGGAGGAGGKDGGKGGSEGKMDRLERAREAASAAEKRAAARRAARSREDNQAEMDANSNRAAGQGAFAEGSDDTKGSAAEAKSGGDEKSSVVEAKTVEATPVAPAAPAADAPAPATGGGGGGAEVAWASDAAAQPSSDMVTNGVRVEVQASYSPEQSNPKMNQWVFVYKVRITNDGAKAVQLVSRKWLIETVGGGKEIVKGPGVVGQQPVIEAMQSFEYTSFCPLRVKPQDASRLVGRMAGHYLMVSGDVGQESFEAEVAPFYLVLPDDV